MELADLVVINKADIDPLAASRAEAQIASVLRVYSPPGSPGDPHRADAVQHWSPCVMQLSALKGQGVDAFIAQVDRFHRLRRASGEFAVRRQQQAMAWMWDLIHARLQSDFRQHPAVRARLPALLTDVREARVAPSVAARVLLAEFETPPSSPNP
jgi:LAO/AO transport system kinase